MIEQNYFGAMLCRIPAEVIVSANVRDFVGQQSNDVFEPADCQKSTGTQTTGAGIRLPREIFTMEDS